MIAEILHVVLDYIWWSSEHRTKNPFWHAVAFVSFWAGLAVVVTLVVLRLI